MEASTYWFAPGRRPVRGWSEQEEEEMRANYRALGVKEMCRRLKRSKGSVTGKAVQMGLAGKWTLLYRAA
jgi:hypothetical protein